MEVKQRKNMKVAFCSPDNNASSGAFLSMANLARELQQMGVDTIVILPTRGNCAGPGDGIKVLQEYGLRYYLVNSHSWIIPVNYKSMFIRVLVKWKNRIDRIRNIYSVIQLYRIVKKEKIEIIHINTLYCYYALYVAKLTKIFSIWHIREFLEEDQEMKINNKKRGYKLINRSDRIIVISKSLYEKYSQFLYKEKMRIIYNGIDTKRFYDKNHIILTDQKVKFLYVGGISRGKGVIELINACHILNMKGYKEKYNLLIAGRGTEEFQNYMVSLIKEYNLSNVKYLGFVKEINELIGKTDVSIITSRAEAFGRTTVEAMLGGNLVIGSDTAGTKELLHEREFGLMFKCANAESLADQMEYVFYHKDECRKKACKAREYMNINMNSKLNAENIYKLYAEIIKDRRDLG